jgi:hypothetical protein
MVAVGWKVYSGDTSGLVWVFLAGVGFFVLGWFLGADKGMLLDQVAENWGGVTFVGAMAVVLGLTTSLPAIWIRDSVSYVRWGWYVVLAGLPIFWLGIWAMEEDSKALFSRVSWVAHSLGAMVLAMVTSGSSWKFPCRSMLVLAAGWFVVGMVMVVRKWLDLPGTAKFLSGVVDVLLSPGWMKFLRGRVNYCRLRRGSPVVGKVEELVLPDVVVKWLDDGGRKGGVLWLRGDRESMSRPSVHSMADSLRERGYVMVFTGKDDRLVYVADLSGLSDDVLKQMGLIRYDFRLEEKVIGDTCP